MKVIDLKDKKITVMGLGLHGGGIGTVRFLSLAGARLIVTDLKSKEELAPSLEKLKDLKNIEYVLGQHRPEDFSKTDIVIKTPPVPWDNKYVKIALENKVPVEIDSSLFFKLCPCPIIGVTGTRGKTTTASLIFEILKTAGKNPVKAGIGQISVMDKLRDLKKDNIVVFELSSWRLSALGRSKISPKIAVVTNVYRDHMNYYKGMEAYVRDKKNIFLYQKAGDVCILNADNQIVAALEPEVKAELMKFSLDQVTHGKGIFVEDGKIYLNNGVDKKEVMPVSEIKLKGRHNIPNVLAAVGAAFSAGADLKSARKAIGNFSGLPHRLEFVREIAGVKYYNDTAATSPEGAISGIDAFSEPVILISGGADKDLDVSGLAQKIISKVKGVVFLKGTATEKIISEMKRIIPEEERRDFKIVDSMAKAIELARSVSDPGDVVLLSPGVASFGLFANEFDRGNKFKEAVAELE